MCLAKAFLNGDDDDQLVLEDVALVEVGDRTLRLSSVFGEEKELEAVVKAVDFQSGRLLLGRPG